jgi:signal peptidase II
MYPLSTIGTYLAALVALVDQMTKSWIVRHVGGDNPSILTLNDWFNLVLSRNKGITFGLLNDHGEIARYLFIAVALTILVVLMSWLRKTTSIIEALGLGLVSGGAIGNIVDRLRFGAVIDFIDFHIENHHWYTFNVGDSAICCGVILLMAEHLVTKPKKG